MSNYRVLWIDDEYRTSEATFEDANERGIELIAFSNAEEALAEINQNHQLYDAVILDGLFFESADQHAGDESQQGFGKVAQELRFLKKQGVMIPWFIYSGQPSFVKERNDFVELLKDDFFAKGKVFDKNKDEDFWELCEEIKKASTRADEFQIRNKHAEPFSAFGENFLPISKEKLLLKLFVVSEKNKVDKEHYQLIRDLYEDVMIDLNKGRILPDELINQHGKPNLQGCVYFFTKGFDPRDGRFLMFNDHIPQHISKGGLQFLKDISSILSHSTDEKHTIYAFRSALNLLCETLIWYKDLIREKGY